MSISVKIRKKKKQNKNPPDSLLPQLFYQVKSNDCLLGNASYVIHYQLSDLSK